MTQQADGLRAEVVRLSRALDIAQLDVGNLRAAQLLEANERLVLAALQAEDIAETAVNNLSMVAQLNQSDTPLHARREDAEAYRSPPAANQIELPLNEQAPRLQALRQANEQLVIAAMDAQELEARTTEAHRRQIAFLAKAAHELRNPLAPIRMAAGLLTGARADAALLGKLQGIIARQAAHMSKLVDDLLDSSRVSAGKFRVERGTADMHSVLNQAIETCRPAMDARLQHFTLKAPSGALNVHGDAVRLAQIFNNLLDNASKYTPEGGTIKLKVHVHHYAMIISVSDNGFGISAEALPHIFDMFVQDTHATALHNGGLGIGLAVVRELVEAHGGTVIARSAGTSLGSQFIVTLPMAEWATADDSSGPREPLNS